MAVAGDMSLPNEAFAELTQKDESVDNDGEAFAELSQKDESLDNDGVGGGVESTPDVPEPEPERKKLKIEKGFKSNLKSTHLLCLESSAS